LCCNTTITVRQGVAAWPGARWKAAPGRGGSPALNGNAALCAGLNRCVAQFSTAEQNTPSDYYKNAPCNYYSAFWHSVAVNGLQYGFAYDDDNGQSSDFNTTDAQYVQVAIGF
jgi:hypothetical protein